jgi:hypothetical protein
MRRNMLPLRKKGKCRKSARHPEAYLAVNGWP